MSPYSRSSALLQEMLSQFSIYYLRNPLKSELFQVRFFSIFFVITSLPVSVFFLFRLPLILVIKRPVSAIYSMYVPQRSNVWNFGSVRLSFHGEHSWLRCSSSMLRTYILILHISVCPINASLWFRTLRSTNDHKKTIQPLNQLSSSILQWFAILSTRAWEWLCSWKYFIH